MKNSQHFRQMIRSNGSNPEMTALKSSCSLKYILGFSFQYFHALSDSIEFHSCFSQLNSTATAVEQLNTIKFFQGPYLCSYGGLSHMEYFGGGSKTSCTRNCMKRTKLGIADL